MERRSNWEIKDRAHGRVLIAGMGIGMILHPILDPRRHKRGRGKYDNALPRVDHVVVVERNPNVIALVGPTLMRYDGRVTIVQADIHDYNPKEKFDTVYFDIWQTIDTENLPEIASLHQRWKGRLNRSGDAPPFMNSWMVEMLRAERESDRREWGWLG